MIKLDSSQLRPGQIVAADVMNRLDRLLIPAGTALSQKQLRILKVWGIREVFIEGLEEPDRSEETAVAEQLDVGPESQAHILFQHTDLEHPLIKELYRVCLAKMRMIGNEADDQTD